MHKPSSVHSLSTTPSLPARADFSLLFASLLLLPPLGVCNPPEQPTWFFLSLLLLLLLLLFRCLFLFLPLFRLLLLSATHLYSVNPFHCENVVLQFTLSPHPRFSIRTPYSLSFPLHSSSFLPFFMRRSRTLQFLVSVLSFSFPRFRERTSLPSFFSTTPSPDRALPVALLSFSCFSSSSSSIEEQPLDFRLFNPLN